MTVGCMNEVALLCLSAHGVSLGMYWNVVSDPLTHSIRLQQEHAHTHARTHTHTNTCTHDAHTHTMLYRISSKNLAQKKVIPILSRRKIRGKIAKFGLDNARVPNN